MASPRARAYPEDMSNYTSSGLKILTPDNWNRLDPEDMGSIDPVTLQPRPTVAQDAADTFLAEEFKMPDHVPQNLRDLYDSARACAVYAVFYRPLNEVAVMLLGRLLDAAAAEAMQLQHIELPKSQSETFNNRIDALQAAGILTPDDRQLWHAWRKLRNQSVHEAEQDALTPGIMAQHLLNVRHAVSLLFF